MHSFDQVILILIEVSPTINSTLRYNNFSCDNNYVYLISFKFHTRYRHAHTTSRRAIKKIFLSNIDVTLSTLFNSMLKAPTTLAELSTGQYNILTNNVINVSGISFAGDSGKEQTLY